MEGMMSKRTIGFLLIALGVILALISLAADVIGIGQKPGIGGVQILGAVIGVVMAIVGVWIALSNPSQKK
jgi:uncharacterized membrane protein